MLSWILPSQRGRPKIGPAISTPLPQGKRYKKIYFVVHKYQRNLSHAYAMHDSFALLSAA